MTSNKNGLLHSLLDELQEICIGLDIPGGPHNGAEAWEKIKEAIVRVAASAKSEETLSITISGNGLLDLIAFTCPDHETDPEQKETEIVLLNHAAFTSTDGDEMPSGLYVYLADYPEEGLYGPVGKLITRGGEHCTTASPSSSKA